MSWKTVGSTPSCVGGCFCSLRSFHSCFHSKTSTFLATATFAMSRHQRPVFRRCAFLASWRLLMLRKITAMGLQEVRSAETARRRPGRWCEWNAQGAGNHVVGLTFYSV